jgi:hypothetical protein
MAPIVWNDFYPMTSKMDWCEPNYAVTSYIAEFYNTVGWPSLAGDEGGKVKVIQLS